MCRSFSFASQFGYDSGAGYTTLLLASPNIALGEAPRNTLVLALVEGDAENNEFLQAFIAKDLQFLFQGFDVSLPAALSESAFRDSVVESDAEVVVTATKRKRKQKSRALPVVEPVTATVGNEPQCLCGTPLFSSGRIQCRQCSRAFHGPCVGIEDVPLAQSTGWTCLVCVESSIPVPVASAVPHISGSVPGLNAEELKLCDVKNTSFSAHCAHCASERQTRSNGAVASVVNPIERLTTKPKQRASLQAPAARRPTRGELQQSAATNVQKSALPSEPTAAPQPAKLRVTAILSCDGKAVNIFCGLQKGGNIKHFCPKCLVGEVGMVPGVSHAPGQHLQDVSKLYKPRTVDLIQQDFEASSSHERYVGVLTRNQQHMPVASLSVEEMICPTPLHYNLGLGNDIDDLIEERLDKKHPAIRKLQLEEQVLLVKASAKPVRRDM